MPGRLRGEASIRSASSRSAGDGSWTAVMVSCWMRGRASGVTRIESRTQPRSPRSHQARWVGEKDSSGRSRSRRNGPSSAAASASAACRRSRGSSRSMFIANASSATSSSHAASRPSTTGRNASTALDGVTRRRGTASAATSARSCSATTGRTGRTAGSPGRSRPGRSRDATPCATRSPDSRPRARSRSRAPCRRARRGRSRRRRTSAGCGSWAGRAGCDGTTSRWPCCISRREARRSGWSPSGSSRAGNASRNPATQRARSRTLVNTPPIEASAPYGSVPSRISALSRRTYPWTSRSSGTSSARYAVDVIPSGTRIRSRTTSRYSRPDALVMTRPRMP